MLCSCHLVAWFTDLLITHVLQVGAKSEGAVGAAKGLGRGLAGLMWNPVKATTGMATKSVTGMINMSGKVMGMHEDVEKNKQEIYSRGSPSHAAEGLKYGAVLCCAALHCPPLPQSQLLLKSRECIPAPSFPAPPPKLHNNSTPECLPGLWAQ